MTTARGRLFVVYFRQFVAVRRQHATAAESVLHMTSRFSKFRGPILLGSAVAMMSLFYTFRHELIGDLSEDRAALFHQTDQEGTQKLKENIREANANFFKNLIQEKKK